MVDHQISPREEGHKEEASETEYASAEEAASAIEALSEPDFVRLSEAAKHFAWGNLAMEPQELINETVKRILEDTRPWPRTLGLVRFLCGVMKSIAHDNWRKHNSAVSTSRRLSTIVDGGKELPSSASNPEQLLLDQEEEEKEEHATSLLLSQIEELFDDDPDVLSIMMGIEDGLSASEIRDLFGYSETRYATAWRRMRRKIAANFPGGRKS